MSKIDKRIVQLLQEPTTGSIVGSSIDEVFAVFLEEPLPKAPEMIVSEELIRQALESKVRK